MISGNLRAADELGRQCLELALASGDQSLLLEAHHRQWATKFFMGDYAAAEPIRILASRPTIPTGIIPDVHLYRARSWRLLQELLRNVLWLRGYPDQALAPLPRGHGVGRASVSSLHHGVGAVGLAAMFIFCGANPMRDADRLDKWIALSKEFDLSPAMIGESRFQLGWALAEEGHAAEGVREMRDGIAASSATGAAHGMQHLLRILARACGESGEASEGLNLLERALGIAEVRREVSAA